ncbi:MAG: bifunctional methylenetetrahydrofolate dehydrogenase/methenyltetrahydrofolate cyclohydrolase FolD [Firmicutes bacterium]|nr:bifunctional methylenetetrahydrofolate dehydrogenase/methenyltetrahydrofolate cyclohydrolase FolD [Bacillota bacterium]
MAAQIIDGKKIAQEIRNSLKQEVAELKERGITPGLAVVLVGEDPASQVYVRLKERACAEVGLYSRSYRLPVASTQTELLNLIDELNRDPQIHGILVQSPPPAHIDEQAILKRIRPDKDVDGFHPVNVGKLMIGEPGLRPCTPLGCLELLDRIGCDLTGKKAVVIGRSNIVGKPMAVLLLSRHATVTICHSRTRDLAAEVRSADVVVVAVGQPGLVTGEMLKPGAVVIDVGINRLPDGRLVGDVDFTSAVEVAGWITPVPGGVGPMTIAMLLKNTVEAAKQQC